ncbi:MAG: hypothetical protein R3Y24_00760 [Eubacteriales bacterium]
MSILKIIGVIVLSILIAVIVILLCVLFIPIYYKAEGQCEEKPFFKGKASWLFPIVRGIATYEEELHYELRVFGIKVYDNLEEKKEKKNKKQKTKSKKIKSKKAKSKKAKRDKVNNREEHKTRDEKKAIEVDKKDGNIKKTEDSIKKTEDSIKKTVLIHEKKVESEKSSSSKRENVIPSTNTFSENTETLKSDKGLFEKSLNKFITKINAIKQKIINIYKKIVCQIRGTYGKIKEIFKNISYYYELLQRESTKEVIRNVLEQVFRLLKHILPQKWIVYLDLGFDDPATLGNVFAIHGMLYGIIGKHIDITPYWEEEVLRVKGNAKGRIQIIVIIICAWKLFTDKELKRLLRIIKKEDV